MHFISDIVSQLLQWVESLGYFGIMLGLMIEVIPSEIVLAYGGYLVHTKSIGFVGAVVFGVIGGVIAQLFVYWIGRYGGRPVLEKYGKYIFIHKKHIDAAEAWFNKYGSGVIFTARFIPVVRHAISIPAGISKMNIWRFTILTTLATIPWSILFIYLGSVLGEKWENINQEAKPYVTPILLVALALLIVYFVIKMVKSRSRKGTK
ncbi:MULTISPECIES: DedA family protein [Paenibacillus]|uniref:Membrane protein n=1 Tax=Paenibacillus albilobatus TaxID=2716884 RepID=A0A919XJR0_9BACL|nr:MULTISPECIES: DedA family protein [Paenibacillus]GIO34202.1 membrane protein [Paenibacillus albilobatus]